MGQFKITKIKKGLGDIEFGEDRAVFQGKSFYRSAAVTETSNIGASVWILQYTNVVDSH